MKKLMLFSAVSFVLFAGAVAIGCGGNKTSNTPGSSPSGFSSSGSGSGSGSGAGSGGNTSGRQYLYATYGSISEFKINGDGTLTSIGVVPNAGGQLLAAANGTLLVAANVKNPQGTVSSYRIGSSGNIALESFVSVPDLSSIALDNSGSTAYAGLSGTTASISELAVPELTSLSGSPIVLNDSQGNPYWPDALTMAANNKFLYSASSSSGTLAVLIRNPDGTIAGFAPGSPVFGCGTNGPSAAGQALVIANEPNQTYAFQACGGLRPSIGSSAIDPATGRILKTFPPFQSPSEGLTPYTVDPSGKWLFANAAPAGNLEILSIDPTTGSLKEDGKHGFFNSLPWSLDASGKFFYSTLNDNIIVGYSFDANSGLLTHIGGAAYPAGVTEVIIVAQ